MAKIQFIDHNGVKVLHCDYSNMDSTEEILNQITEEKALIAQQPQESLYVLTDVTNILVNKEIDDALTEMVRHNKPYVKKSAVLGVSGFKKTVYNIMMALTGRDIKIFDDLDTAKEWLTT